MRGMRHCPLEGGHEGEEKKELNEIRVERKGVEEKRTSALTTYIHSTSNRRAIKNVTRGRNEARYGGRVRTDAQNLYLGNEYSSNETTRS